MKQNRPSSSFTNTQSSALMLGVASLSMAMFVAATQCPTCAADYQLYADPSMQTNGLVGSYVNQNLRTQPPQSDWRGSYPISGTRIDSEINFGTLTWGNLAAVGLTGGFDPNFGWENFSVQWDGYVKILTNDVMLATKSDDSSRMWIDVNQDGSFSTAAGELMDNNWGIPQAETLGTFSPPLAPGLYRIRLQYQEDYFGNSMQVISERAGGYHDFSGNVHYLEELRGKFTRLLLSKADLEKMSLPQARELLDQQDILYAQLKELTGSEPAGDGLLTVAFVKTCGAGCGNIGSKGVEIDPDFAGMPIATTYDFIAHEMTHNFDTMSSYFMFGPDAGHGWTAWIQNYLDVATRRGSGARSAENYQAFRVNELFTNPYLSVPGHSWSSCVESNDYCGDLASFLIQAGFCHKVSAIHGVAAVQRSLVFMRNAIATRGLVPENLSPAQRNDLMLESFSFGTQTNLTCYADAWNWAISPALRLQLANLYGSSNALCADNDGDGYSTIQGDTADNNPNIHPGATEIANGLDDNGNGIVDEITMLEVGNFPSSPATSLGVVAPVRIKGSGNSVNADFFHLDITNETTLQVELISSGSGTGWMRVRGPDDSLKLEAYIPANSSISAAVVLTPGRNEFHVDLSSGQYDLLLSTNQAWPPYQFALSPQPVNSNTWLLQAAALPENLTNRPDVTVRHWVSGQGWIATNTIIANNPNTRTTTWTTPTNFTAAAASYRSQYFTNQVAATRLTEARAFQPSVWADQYASGTNGFTVRFVGHRAPKAVQWESLDLQVWTATTTNNPFLNIWSTTNQTQLGQKFFRVELVDE